VRSLAEYLEALASAEPTPGGGSASALVGATGAALIAMAARITLQSKRFVGVHIEAERIAAEADELRAAFARSGETDEAAYAALAAAYRMPKGSEAEREARTRALAPALQGAAEAPLEIARLAAALAELAERALGLGNGALFSDVLCGAEFALASACAAAANVRINHRGMRDRSRVSEQAAALDHYLRESERIRDGIRLRE
jgi:formiminotetrahydrofolate cyclodeaminase